MTAFGTHPKVHCNGCRCTEPANDKPCWCCDGAVHKNMKPTSKKRVMVKKTSYPSSFSLTNAQYRAVRNGIFDEIVVVDTDSGEVITCFDNEQLFDLTEKAIAKVVGETAEIYFVVRF